MAKDLFSNHAKIYASFRPTYPEALYNFIFTHVNERRAAWDCATGNGQVARRLCTHFDHVYATDISPQQLTEAHQSPNIHYSVHPAEKTAFPDHMFDLITVGQALHWFNLKGFYNEARRTARPNALLAVWGYALLHVNSDVDELFNDFYTNIVGPYWDNARRIVEDQYRSISFPFQEIKAPEFSIDVEWNKAQFCGYLRSWSATQRFIKENQKDPLPELVQRLDRLWGDNEVKKGSFPLFLRLGKAM